MNVRKQGGFALALLIGLGTLMPFLGGCKQEEEEGKNDPHYYTGKDFQGHNVSAPKGEQTTKTSHLRGGE